MKKILISILTMALAFVSCGDDDNNSPEPTKSALRLTKMVEKRTSALDDNARYTAVVELNYGDNGYVSKIVSSYKSKTGGANGEVFFTYNDQKQLVKKEEFNYSKQKKKNVLSETTVYTYDDKGLLISAAVSYPNEKRVRRSTYEYNNQNFMVKERYGDGSVKFVKVYEYDVNGKLVKKYKEGSGGYYTYSFDNTKNPITLVYPKEYRLIEPEIWSDNNIIESKEENPAYDNYKSVYTYSYNAEGYPVQRVEKMYEGTTLRETSTIELFYE